MLDYKILSKKQTISNSDGTKYYDLLTQTFDGDVSISGTPLIVNKYYVARPDLISQAMYGTDMYADIICKINGISNPFELNENDMILIPSLEYCQQCIKKNPTASVLISDSANISNVQTQSDYQKTLSETRSPNEQTSGEKNYIIDQTSGFIFY